MNPKPDRARREEAARLGAKAHLENIRLLSLQVHQAPSLSSPELVWIQTTFEQHALRGEGGAVQVRIPYSVVGTAAEAADEDQAGDTAPEAGSATGRPGAEVLRIDAEWVLDYRLPGDFPCTEGELDSFAAVSGMFAAHPYMRELVQSLTTRMGFPPLVLDVLRSPLDIEPEPPDA